jgi:GNAT superfamily N-acetyltransferase
MVNISNRPFHDEADIERITQFLLDTYQLNQSLHNWDARRWQGRVYHSSPEDYADYLLKLPQLVHIWEADATGIVGVVIPEYAGGIFLQIHPDYRHIEPQMLDWVEAHHMQAADDESMSLDVWSYETDTYRNQLLTQRGYQRQDAFEMVRRRDMVKPIPSIDVPDGYQVRAMRVDEQDVQHQAALLNAAFKRDFHSPEEYAHFQQSPYYRAELDIVVEAPDGTLAANAGFTAHEPESFAVLEPVCTHPDHQGKGLAGAAIAEGLRRIAALKISTCYVGAWYTNPVSNHLYEKMGFADGQRFYVWKVKR